MGGARVAASPRRRRHRPRSVCLRAPQLRCVAHPWWQPRPVRVHRTPRAPGDHRGKQRRHCKTLMSVSGRNLAISAFGAAHAKANKMPRRGRLRGISRRKKIPQYNMRYDSVITRRAMKSMSFYLSVGARAPVGNSNLKSHGRGAIIMDGQP